MHPDQLLPSARVVRDHGAPVAPPTPRVGDQFRRAWAPIAEHGREGLTMLIGLWPLTAIMAVMFALLWAAGTTH